MFFKNLWKMGKQALGLNKSGGIGGLLNKARNWVEMG